MNRKFQAGAAILALSALTGTPTSARPETQTEATAESTSSDGLNQKLQGTVTSLNKEADKMKGSMPKEFLSAAEEQEIRRAAERMDAPALNAIIEKKTGEVEKSKKGYEHLTILISFISLLWFANMIVGCMKGKPVSFIQHHLPFVLGLIAMGTQIPQEILHGMVESLVAFVAIMLISRGARGVTNKVDFSQLNEEQAKTILVVLGPLASLITTPALATIFAPLREVLQKRDKYIAMHSVSNVDGGMAVGDFPFLYVWMQKGILAGTAWQAKLMLPVMLFNKILQAILLKVGPSTIWKNKELIWEVIKGFSFEKSRLGKSHDIVSEETAHLKEFLGYIQEKIKVLEGELGPETAAAIDEVLSREQSAVSEDEASALGEDKAVEDENAPATQLMRFKMLEGELTNVLQDKAFLSNHVGEAVVLLRNALADGKLTQEELEAFQHGDKTQELLSKVPGLKGWVINLERSADQIYSKICEKLRFSHNEVEIGRVFTAQALAIGLLTPVISTFLGHAPFATEAVATTTSAFADNYAATAITWISNNSKALSFSILAGTLTIYGNMANLNFLGKDANFKDSVYYAGYMIPTLLFSWMMTNPEKVQEMVSNPSEAAKVLGAAGVAGLVYKSRDKIAKLFGKKESAT